MCRTLSALLVACCTLLSPSCKTWSVQYFAGDDSWELARVERPDGSKDVFELQVKPGGADASLRVTSDYVRTRAFLGFKVLELDRATAERRGVGPYSGLLVSGTYPKSSAEAGGVLAGDVLLSLDGRDTVYQNQVPEFEAGIRPGRAVVARVLRGQTPTDLNLTANALQESITEPQDVELEKPPASQPYAGVVLRGIPAVWCERMYGTARPTIVIASVDLGSPAWVAGFRGGDLIESVDGGDVPPLRDLALRIRDRGLAQQPIRLRVRRGADVHEADIALSDYTEESDIWFPLIFRVRDGVQMDRWSVGPFALLLSNRNSYVGDSTRRQPVTENSFSALFGLFQVRSGPRDSCVRLLWFIHIDT